MPYRKIKNKWLRLFAKALERALILVLITIVGSSISVWLAKSNTDQATFKEAAKMFFTRGYELAASITFPFWLSSLAIGIMEDILQIAFSEKLVKTILYYVVHIIWGFPSFIFGAIVAIAMLVTKHKPHRFGYAVYFISRSTGGWGFSCGPFFVLSADCKDLQDMKQHEHGHGMQVLWWGPLFLFVIAIPSMIRFHYREYQDVLWRTHYVTGKLTKAEYDSLLYYRPAYEDIWFERQADELGERYFSFKPTKIDMNSLQGE